MTRPGARGARRRLLALLALVLAFAFAVAGCGGDEPAGGTSPTEQSETMEKDEGSMEKDEGSMEKDEGSMEKDSSMKDGG